MENLDRVIEELERALRVWLQAQTDRNLMLVQPDVVEDALAILKALAASRQARVIRKDELAYIMPGAVVWYDEQTSEWSEVLMPICPVCVEGVGITDWNGKQKVMIQYTDGYDDVADYGKGYRLWTARPTDEQRRGEKWN